MNLFEGHSDLSLWAEKQIVKPTNIEVSKKDKTAHNVDCAFKLSSTAAEPTEFTTMKFVTF